MTFLDAIIMGIVEGLSEYLPISSTGHLILTSHLLGFGQNSSDAEKAFDIIIQSGAILAVLYEYRKTLSEKLQSLWRKEENGLSFFLKLFCSFLPAAVIGLLIHDFIKEKLFGIAPVILALLVGGIVMIVVERKLNKTENPSKKTNDFPNFKQAWGIGFFQVLSMWPGTSRSMTTILGARILGLKASAAAEYSFFLALPTLMAATTYDFLKNKEAILSQEGQLLNLLIGTVVSFFVALIVIRWFIQFLKKQGLEVFGWYRIIFSIVVFAYFYS